MYVVGPTPCFEARACKQCLQESFMSKLWLVLNCMSTDMAKRFFSGFLPAMGCRCSEHYRLWEGEAVTGCLVKTASASLRLAKQQFVFVTNDQINHRGSRNSVSFAPIAGSQRMESNTYKGKKSGISVCSCST